MQRCVLAAWSPWDGRVLLIRLRSFLACLRTFLSVSMLRIPILSKYKYNNLTYHTHVSPSTVRLQLGENSYASLVAVLWSLL
jgi:hypothetical protein